MESEYQRYEKPYSYEVRDRRVRGARGLQAVDGLTTSAVFDEAAERYVAGDIGARQLSDIVDDYYDQKVERGINRYSQEADLVSARICDALDSNGFTFSPHHPARHPRAPLPRPHGTALLRAALPRLQHLEARVRPRAGIGGLRGLRFPRGRFGNRPIAERYFVQDPTRQAAPSRKHWRAR